jgi:hypothetical protein
MVEHEVDHEPLLDARALSSLPHDRVLAAAVREGSIGSA